MAGPMTFLFWNLNGQDRIEIVRRLVRLHEVDVLILAESGIAPAKVITSLSDKRDSFTRPRSQCAAIDVYTRFPDASIAPVWENRRVSIRRLKLPLRDEILIVMAHLRSKLHRSDVGQTLVGPGFARRISEAEDTAGHGRTVLIGDLNMNPFDPAVFGATGLHAVSTRERAARLSRVVDGERLRFFYNPMWNHMGDRGGKVAGTYFYRSAEPDALFWHTVDQVLIRPELLHALGDDGVQVLTSDGKISFLRNGIPDRRKASDHLPLLLRLYL
jgi:hypothetical protein